MKKKKHRKLSNNYWTSGSAIVPNDTNTMLISPKADRNEHRRIKADLKEDATTEKLAEYATHGPDVHREGVVAGAYHQTDHIKYIRTVMSL
jgi:hypothetical protein